MSSWFDLVHLRDAVDVLLVAFFIYRGLRLLRGTRGIAVMAGLAALGLLYLVAGSLGLQTLHWILEALSPYLALAILVLFQEDIRRGLARVAAPLLRGGIDKGTEGAVPNIARAAFRLAEQGHGALIALERSAALDELEDSASVLDAEPNEELLVAIFQPTSPLHDGAAVVRKGRLWLAGAFLPLSDRPDLDKQLGTRHRAALGLTDKCDAIVFVVSEERRTVSVAYRGDLRTVSSPDELRLEVQRHALSPADPEARPR